MLGSNTSVPTPDLCKHTAHPLKQHQISRSNPQSILYRLLFNMLLSLQVRIRSVAIRRGSLYNL